jgi:hypothetical protein
MDGTVNIASGFVFANAKGNAMNREALARDVIRPAIKESGIAVPFDRRSLSL